MSVDQPAEKKAERERSTTTTIFRGGNENKGAPSKSPAAPAGEEPEERPPTMQVLSQYLMEEQEKRAKLREEHNLHSTWKDLQSAYESAPDLIDLGGEHMYDTFDDANAGTGNLVNRLAMAASRTQSSFMGSPDQSILKDRKSRKERKKKKKDAKKEAKKQARMMITNRSSHRF